MNWLAVTNGSDPSKLRVISEKKWLPFHFFVYSTLLLLAMQRDFMFRFAMNTKITRLNCACTKEDDAGKEKKKKKKWRNSRLCHLSLRTISGVEMAKNGGKQSNCELFHSDSFYISPWHSKYVERGREREHWSFVFFSFLILVQGYSKFGPLAGSGPRRPDQNDKNRQFSN